jgi:hypothetical protein
MASMLVDSNFTPLEAASKLQVQGPNFRRSISLGIRVCTSKLAKVFELCHR